MKIAVLDDWFDTLRQLPCFGLLAGHQVQVLTDHIEDPVQLAEQLAGVEALVLIRDRTRVTRALVERLPSLRLISQRSAFTHIDLPACTEHGVLVCSEMHNDAPSYAAAELTWALVLAAMRQIPQQVASLRAGRWQYGVGHSLRGKTLGVYGYGRIGREVAKFGRAFGMSVQFWARPESLDRARQDGWSVADTKAAFFETSDIVSLHMRLVDATKGIVTAADLARMRPDSLLVNSSRAGLIAPGALLEALRQGRPGSAALDVFEQEPLTDSAHPLLQMDNVICTPHIGFVTYEERDQQFTDVFRQIQAFAAGAPVNMVNPEALTAR